MSASDGNLGHSHASHGAHAHGPAPLPEPKTPLWLTAVGIVLFLVVGLWWAFRSSGPSSVPQETSQNAVAGSTQVASAQAQAARVAPSASAPPVQSARPLQVPGGRNLPPGFPSALPPGFKHP